MQPWLRWKPPFLRKGKAARILFFSHETTWSGAPIQLLHLITWLKRKGWEVAAAVPKPSSPQSGPISSQLTDLGIDLFPVLDLAVAPDLNELRSLCSRFDLVVANTLVMWAAVRAAHDCGAPVIWYVHETLLLWRFIELNADIQPTLALPDLIVLPTHQTASLYAPLTQRPLQVVPYGIPPAKAHSQISRDRSRTRFLVLGSYEHRKGQDLFLEAIAQLPVALQATAFFQMAGRILDEQFYRKIAEQAHHSNVLLCEALEHDEALTAIAAADVIVCASRDETMPIALLEAMSLGKAIITTNVGGVTEWLRDRVNALVIPAEESQALARSIQECLEDPALVRSLGIKARRTFSAEFSLDRMGKSFAGLFHRLLRERKP